MLYTQLHYNYEFLCCFTTFDIVSIDRNVRNLIVPMFKDTRANSDVFKGQIKNCENWEKKLGEI